MALNIGANDVANNMGPAVGANALTMGGAIAIAVVFESAGALIAGGDVVSTIAKGIIAPESMGNANTFIWAMMAALLSAALWVNLATWVGAPVSTTHSVVGGGHGGRDRGGRFRCRKLADDERDCRKLGDLAGPRRCHRRPVPCPDQVPHHLPRRQDRRRPHLGAGPCRHHGGGLRLLPRPQGSEETHQDRHAHGPHDRAGHRRDRLGGHDPPDPQSNPRGWKTATSP